MKKRKFFAAIFEITLVCMILATLFINLPGQNSIFGNLGSHLSGFTIYNFQPDSSAGKDTYISELSNNTNYGSSANMLVGKNIGGNNFRGLIQFNLTSITGTVLSAELQVNMSSSNSNNNITINIYRVTSQWTELGATWINASSSQPWSSVGGDYDPQIIDSIKFSNISRLYNFTISGVVQGWVNGTYPNYGLLLLSPDAGSGDYKVIDTSSAASATTRPEIIIDYTANAPPSITGISTDSSPLNLKEIGNQVNFNVSWTDMEGDSANVYICNSSNISFAAGCLDKTFCSTSLSYANPIQCSYTVSASDNRTTNFFVVACDSYNCSQPNQSQFYMNHPPLVLIVQPNGGETVNQSKGNYQIKFNVSDPDADSLTGSIYYGPSQNSTSFLIASNLNFANYCTGTSTITPNNCSYFWNSSDIYGTFYITVIANDSLVTGTGSSNSSFNVRSMTDTIPPNILSQVIDPDPYSGKQVQISANITDDHSITAWATINTTPLTNISLTNLSSATFYNGSFLAPAIGNYQFKIYAIDTPGNLNDTMPWQSFSVRAPNATTGNNNAPAVALPYHTIKVTGDLTGTDSLRNIYAYLNTPAGFTFLSNYPQNTYMGNLSSNQTKTAVWFLSVPLNQGSYILNITYYDPYQNNWSSSNIPIQVSSAAGGYELDINGYPVVQAGSDYYSEAYFSQSGSYSAADSVQISIYDPLGNLIVGPSSMPLKQLTQPGVYAYTYSVPSSQTSGQWETIVNATKSSVSYYASEFWKLVGALFDIKDVTVINSNINSLNISVTAYNTGTVPADLTLGWNLTRTDTGQQLSAGGETFAVGANQSLTRYYSPSTNYIGQVKITFLGRYSGTETAGAYSIFSTTSSGAFCGDGTCNNGETCSSCPSDCGACSPSGGGGGGTGTGGTISQTASMAITADTAISIEKNTPKTITVQVSNNGQKTLNNIRLELNGLDSSEYVVSPAAISSLGVGETGSFQVTITMPDVTGEQDFSYVANANEATVQESAKLSVLSTYDYLNSEISSLNSQIAGIKGSTSDSNIIAQLKICQALLDNATSQLAAGNLIDAKDSITQADSCVSNAQQQKYAGVKSFFSFFTGMFSGWKVGNFLFVLLLSFMIAAVVYVIFMLKKTNFNFKRSVYNPRVRSRLNVEVMGAKYFDDRIKRIQDKLGG